MNERKEFHPLQAQEIAGAFNDQGVGYLFIGKSGAILLGFPGTTQDVHIFPARSAENGRRIRAEYEKAHAPDLRSAADIAAGNQSSST